MTDSIDFVVSWLDSNDPIWQEQYYKYKNQGKKGDTSTARYREWDLFHYWFRAVETYAPWVNKVYLVTNGKFPDWINKNHPKLVLIKHSDYIPEEFLPTFNSRTIELYLHKIHGLSEHFVYFNDDFYLNAPITPDYYFKDGLPCDYNRETVFNVPIYSAGNKFGTYHTILSDIGVINAHFNRWVTVRQSMKRWFGPHLGIKGILLSFNLRRQHRFIGFKWRHYEQPFLKSVFEDAWEKECEMLTNSCTRFREPTTLNQYFFRYWQFATNKFHPISKISYRYLSLIKNNLPTIKKILLESKIKSVCLNDVPYCTHEEYLEMKKEIHQLFEQKFPKKSLFEK